MSDIWFLWVVRSPPSELLLPDGFLERTKDKGLVVKSWAPQVEVLNHESVGGIRDPLRVELGLGVGSCNAGVPMAAWPLYAEQKFSSIVLTQEMELALPINQMEDGLVTATEIEKVVRGLMESEEGKILKERTLKKKKEAKLARSEGGIHLFRPWRILRAHVS